VEIKKDPSQNSTDLMKCIEEIESQELSSSANEQVSPFLPPSSNANDQIPILLIGGLSGRVDQTVHTMSLLHKIRKNRDEVYVLNGESVAWVLDEVSFPFPLLPSPGPLPPFCFLSIETGYSSSEVKAEAKNRDHTL
jgi:thiamine pyrophosphokinase